MLLTILYVTYTLVTKLNVSLCR